uniref:Uncharacterized protein n=1 Tax=Rhizophagus irregularis (strain DAOM 181602 / DAOM 197198 / MUCL 43194) TaxID=747089 RepID=U9SY80_RHIID
MHRGYYGPRYTRIVLNYGKCITRPAVFCNTNDHLRDEHNDNLFESSKLSESLPAYPFIPNKDRYKIGIKDANEDSNLDNSPIRSGRNDKKYFES